jgi:hypothetical protein
MNQYPDAMGHDMSSDTIRQFTAHEHPPQDCLVIVQVVAECYHLTVVFEDVNFVGCVEKKALIGESVLAQDICRN